MLLLALLPRLGYVDTLERNHSLVARVERLVMLKHERDQPLAVDQAQVALSAREVAGGRGERPERHQKPELPLPRHLPIERGHDRLAHASLATLHLDLDDR